LLQHELFTVVNKSKPKGFKFQRSGGNYCCVTRKADGYIDNWLVDKPNRETIVKRPGLVDVELAA